MRPSSSPSEGLFSSLQARGPVAEQVSAGAWLCALLDVEAALARACASVGLIPADAAQAVADACADASAYDVRQLAAAAGAGGNPVIPLVRAIEERAGDAGRYVHYGATSQDALDTAMLVVARRALVALGGELTAAVDAAAALAAEHRDSVMAGRTLLQQAVPTTFGLKAAGWALALHGAGQRLEAVPLPVQLGGAAGTLASYRGSGTRVSGALASSLGLAPAVLPWHTARLPVADLAGSLGTAAGVLGKVALDVVLLAQTEVAEVTEGGAARGGSSAMPHKRNPVAAVNARASAKRAPGLVATLLSCMEQEHERASGAWQAEWVALSDLLSTVGSATAWLRDCLERLVIDRERMLVNVQADGGHFATAQVALALAPSLGRAEAHDLVAGLAQASRAQGRPLRDLLLGSDVVSDVLDAGQVDALLDPAAHVGEAGALVDAALAALSAHRTTAP